MDRCGLGHSGETPMAVGYYDYDVPNGGEPSNDRARVYVCEKHARQAQENGRTVHIGYAFGATQTEIETMRRRNRSD